MLLISFYYHESGRLPKDIETPTFTLPDDLPKRTLARFKVGEVLKLQCAGEIKSTALQSGEEVNGI